MTQPEEHSPSMPVETEQHRDVDAVTGDQLTTGQRYWQEHEIVRRSPDEIRRGEAAAYVRRCS
ncbi:hypothetical protein [Umezawaea sp. Da 62-37]|uniref:hypothetical protein n=1 Tax=Umezawaea sp. Da 62-37 TaxID=3075927 RepID=UPI0028F73E2D|nr:hypothetical protein [Umezawaea sp. Da 62-37]WNV83027.1 hypothetical protein RM788_33205 [Umezawaea sp. Da 62-37]